MVFRILFMVHDTLSIFIKNDSKYLNWSNNAITTEKKNQTSSTFAAYCLLCNLP